MQILGYSLTFTLLTATFTITIHLIGTEIAYINLYTAIIHSYAYLRQLVIPCTQIPKGKCLPDEPQMHDTNKQTARDNPNSQGWINCKVPSYQLREWTTRSQHLH